LRGGKKEERLKRPERGEQDLSTKEGKDRTNITRERPAQRYKKKIF